MRFFLQTGAFMLLALSAVRRAAASLECRPQGSIVPVPRHLASSQTFQTAAANLTKTLDRAVAGEIEAGWAVENASFSVALVSLSQETPGLPLWEYHHLASGNVNGTRSLDRNSQYLIGSISKVITDAVVIRSGLDLDLPITKYLPQLDNASSLISWPNITLRALASQLAGIPPNYGFSEYYFIKFYFEALGFPPLGDGEFPPCGVIGLNGACSKDDLLQGMLTSRPVAQPMGKPVYSNIAFTLLAYAVEAATGLNYTAQLREYLTGPFGLASTFPSPGDDDLAAIPPVENSWGADYGDGVPGGGLVSTLSDLSVLVHAILTEKLLPTETQTRQWLQPAAFAGAAGTLVGLPWEVFVPAPGVLTPRRPRSIPVYSKGGDAYGYRSRLAVIPELGVGLVVLTAGGPEPVTYVFDAALAVFAAAVDDASREEAAENGYVGRFATPSPSSSNGSVVRNSSIAIAQDDDSLFLTGLTRNGSDILASLPQVWAVTMGRLMPGLEEGFRIFPTGASVVAAGDGGTSVVREDWRLWWGVTLPSGSALPGAGISERDCLRWPLADWLHYGGEAVDRIVFVRDAATGRVLGVEIPFLRTGLLLPTASARS